MYASPQEYLGTHIPTFFFFGGGGVICLWRPKATLHTLPKLESAATDRYVLKSGHDGLSSHLRQ